ncbi:hypothetical protein C8F01DRAFT_1262691 [Mycena amicta]|nr:hypothetical protein C8F01DRAFT_1262691 [Mycena amicta]
MEGAGSIQSPGQTQAPPSTAEPAQTFESGADDFGYCSANTSSHLSAVLPPEPPLGTPHMSMALRDLAMEGARSCVNLGTRSSPLDTRDGVLLGSTGVGLGRGTRDDVWQDTSGKLSLSGYLLSYDPPCFISSYPALDFDILVKKQDPQRHPSSARSDTLMTAHAHIGIAEYGCADSSTSSLCSVSQACVLHLGRTTQASSGSAHAHIRRLPHLFIPPPSPDYPSRSTPNRLYFVIRAEAAHSESRPTSAFWSPDPRSPQLRHMSIVGGDAGYAHGQSRRLRVCGTSVFGYRPISLEASYTSAGHLPSTSGRPLSHSKPSPRRERCFYIRPGLRHHHRHSHPIVIRVPGTDIIALPYVSPSRVEALGGNAIAMPARIARCLRHLLDRGGRLGAALTRERDEDIDRPSPWHRPPPSRGRSPKTYISTDPMVVLPGDVNGHPLVDSVACSMMSSWAFDVRIDFVAGFWPLDNPSYFDNRMSLDFGDVIEGPDVDPTGTKIGSA